MMIRPNDVSFPGVWQEQPSTQPIRANLWGLQSIRYVTPKILFQRIDLNVISILQMQQRCKWGNFWCDLCNVGEEFAPPPGPGWNRVKVSENLGVRPPVAPAVTSLQGLIKYYLLQEENRDRRSIYNWRFGDSVKELDSKYPTKQQTHTNFQQCSYLYQLLVCSLSVLVLKFFCASYHP